METGTVKQQQAGTIQLAAVIRDPARQDWTPHVVVQQPVPVLSDWLRARAELVVASTDCGSCGDGCY